MPISNEMVEAAKKAYSRNQYGQGLDVRLRAALEAAEAVRKPAGDVGEVVRALQAVDHMSVEDCFLQSPLFAKAAELLLRQAGEIEEATHALTAEATRCGEAEAELARLREDGEWANNVQWNAEVEKRKAAEAEVVNLRDRLTEKHREVADLQQDPMFKLKEGMRERAEAAEALLREAGEVIKGLNNLIVQGQKITTETLIGQPRGLSDKAGLGALIGLLDGPEQREAQGKANTFLAKLEATDAAR